MSATYTRISEEQFEDFVSALVPDASRTDVPRTNELVWDLPLPGDLTIRVFSTIEAGAGRDLGEDAIRCVVWNHEHDCPVGGRRKTLRIGPSESNPEGWRRNLREKIQDLYASWRDYNKQCPECSGVLQERVPGPDDDWGRFLACSNWDGGDGCQYTEWL